MRRKGLLSGIVFVTLISMSLAGCGGSNVGDDAETAGAECLGFGNH